MAKVLWNLYLNKYIFAQKPKSCDFCWAIYDKGLTHRYQNWSDQYKKISAVNQSTHEDPDCVKSWTDQKAKSETFRVDDEISREVADWVYEEWSCNGGVEISRGEIVNARNFIGDWNDSVISESIDKKAETHESDDNPAIFFLGEGISGELFDHLLFLGFFLWVFEVGAHWLKRMN